MIPENDLLRGLLLYAAEYEQAALETMRGDRNILGGQYPLFGRTHEN
ncbi:MAG: hypothetical protein K6C36_08490 [Clostridia bacterium]|nr:hypothetical protein [Clostridia bacterium]